MRTAMRRAVEAAAARSGTSPKDLALALELLAGAETSQVKARELEGRLFQYGAGVAGLCALGLAGAEAEAEGDAGVWTDEVRGLQGIEDSGAIGPGSEDAEPAPTLDVSGTERWLEQQEKQRAAQAKVYAAKTDQDLRDAQAELKALTAPPAPRPLSELIPDWQQLDQE